MRLPLWIQRLFVEFILSALFFSNHETSGGSGFLFCDGFGMKHYKLSVLPHTSRGVFMTISSNDHVMEESTLDVLTPKQVRAARKEMLRRRALQSIDTIYWTDDSIAENLSNHSIAVDKRRKIADILVNRSFVQVRGVVSKDHPNDTRIIKNEAERLSVEVQMELRSLVSLTATAGDGAADPVVHILEIKGRMVTFFLESVISPLSNPNRAFHLRTTGKQNNWIKRPKSLRDNAGQIIK